MILNEALQWVALAIVALLAVGAIRQASIATPEIRRGAGGPNIGARLPSDLERELQAVLERPTLGGVAIAFVTEQCRVCQRLIASATERDDVVLIARSPSSQFMSALHDSGLPVVADSEGDVWRSLHVTSTPLVIRVDGDGRVVAKGVTYDVAAVSA